MMLGVPIGSLLGAVIGGWIAEHLNWRLAFVIVGAPGLVLGGRRRADDARARRAAIPRAGVGAAEPVPSTWTTVRYLFAKPTFRHLMVGSVLASFGTMAIGQFLHPYLVRVYHMGYAEAGLIFGSGQRRLVDAGPDAGRVRHRTAAEARPALACLGAGDRRLPGGAAYAIGFSV